MYCDYKYVNTYMYIWKVALTIFILALKEVGDFFKTLIKRSSKNNVAL